MYGVPTAAGQWLPLLLAQSSVQVALNGVQEVRGVQEVFIQLHTAKRTWGRLRPPEGHQSSPFKALQTSGIRMAILPPGPGPKSGKPLTWVLQEKLRDSLRDQRN